jgi:hypothetical protein
MAHSWRSSILGIFRPAGAVALLLATSTALAAAAPKTILVGTLTLKFCDANFNGYCGSLERAFDPSGGVKGNIKVAFVYYPRFDQSRPALAADVTLRQSGKNICNLSFTWNDADINAIAAIPGTINGDRVKARRIAP